MKLETLALASFASFTLASAAVSSPAALVGLLGLSIIGIKNTQGNPLPSFVQLKLQHCKIVNEMSIWGSGLVVTQSETGAVLAKQWDNRWGSCNQHIINSTLDGTVLIQALTGYMFHSSLSKENALQFVADNSETVYVNTEHTIRGGSSELHT